MTTPLLDPFAPATRRLLRAVGQRHVFELVAVTLTDGETLAPVHKTMVRTRLPDGRELCPLAAAMTDRDPTGPRQYGNGGALLGYYDEALGLSTQDRIHVVRAADEPMDLARGALLQLLGVTP